MWVRLVWLAMAAMCGAELWGGYRLILWVVL